MGTCYTYILYDEWDWGYYSDSSYPDSITKEDVIKHIKIDFPVAEILAQWPHYIVIDLDKNSPWGDNVQRLKGRCDMAYYYDDSGGSSLKVVEFKKTPKDKAVEANKPANRNAKYIQEAYNSWKERYDNKAQ